MPTVRSVERAINLLEALLTSPQGLRLVELSERLGLHKTTVLRLLKTVMAMHLVRRTPEERYCWEPLRWLAAAHGLTDMASLLQFAQRLLRELGQTSGQTAALGVADGQERTLTLVVSELPDAPVRIDVGSQVWAPLHACAGGKLHLAHMPESRFLRYVQSGLRAFTSHTVVEVEALRQELAGIREQGYACAFEEYLAGVGSVAVPVCDDTSAVVGALLLIGPREHFTPEHIARWLPPMRAAAGQLTHTLYSLPGGAPAPAQQPVGRPAGEPAAPAAVGAARKYRVL